MNENNNNQNHNGQGFKKKFHPHKKWHHHRNNNKKEEIVNEPENEILEDEDIENVEVLLFFNDTATTENYTALNTPPLHNAQPI